MLSNPTFRIFYLLLIILIIVLQIYCPDNIIYGFSKGALMTSLLLAFLVDTRGISTVLKWTASVAIIFSLAGDILLLPAIDDFLLGLLCFLAVHILFITCFLRVDFRPLAVPFIRRHPWSIFMMILYGGWMFLQLRKGADDLAWAILIYILAIAVMTLTALNREGTVPRKSYRNVAWGALFFVISDSVLAWSRFVRPIDLAPIWILSSYGIAQLLIVTGLQQQITRVDDTI